METARLIEFVPVLAYLLAVWGFQLRRAPVPTWLHVAAAITGLLVNGILISWVAPIVCLTFGAAFFVAAVAFAGKHMTRTGIVTFSVALVAAPPIAGWLGLITGVMIAAVVSFVIIAKRLGGDRAKFTVYESASSLGITGTAMPTRPDSDRIPAPKLDEQGLEVAHGVKRETSTGSMRLAPFMAIGVVLAAAFSLFE